MMDSSSQWTAVLAPSQHPSVAAVNLQHHVLRQAQCGGATAADSSSMSQHHNLLSASLCLFDDASSSTHTSANRQQMPSLSSTDQLLLGDKALSVISNSAYLHQFATGQQQQPLHTPPYPHHTTQLLSPLQLCNSSFLQQDSVPSKSTTIQSATHFTDAASSSAEHHHHQELGSTLATIPPTSTAQYLHNPSNEFFGKDDFGGDFQNQQAAAVAAQAQQLLSSVSSGASPVAVMDLNAELSFLQQQSGLLSGCCLGGDSNSPSGSKGAQFTIIANVPYDTVRQDLVMEFRKYGRVELAMVVCDEASRHPHKEWTSTLGYAFVRFSKRAEAAAAIQAAALGLISIRGTKVRADWARKDSYAKRGRTAGGAPIVEPAAMVAGASFTQQSLASVASTHSVGLESTAEARLWQQQQHGALTQHERKMIMPMIHQHQAAAAVAQSLSNNNGKSIQSYFGESSSTTDSSTTSTTASRADDQIKFYKELKTGGFSAAELQCGSSIRSNASLRIPTAMSMMSEKEVCGAAPSSNPVSLNLAEGLSPISYDLLTGALSDLGSTTAPTDITPMPARRKPRTPDELLHWVVTAAAAAAQQQQSHQSPTFGGHDHLVASTELLEENEGDSEVSTQGEESGVMDLSSLSPQLPTHKRVDLAVGASAE